MAVAAAVIGAIGLGTAIYGQVSAANSQKDAQDKDLALKKKQAQELLEREDLNEALLKRQGEERIADLGASSTSGPIADQLKARRNLQEALMFARRDANFKAMMLREGADIQAQLSSDQLTGSYIASGGTLLSGFASTYNAYNNLSAPGNTTGTPQAPNSYTGVTDTPQSGAVVGSQANYSNREL